ncbi:MAG TPA: 3-isopropylmalate dehydratase large subunit [Fimbriimonas sp.]|nr:3-isopropylmalate dehydratase large subunit [Fimbriimonas sp.]
MAGTLFDKVWDSHLVDTLPGGGSLLYIDRHLVHEVTSPQAFGGLREAGRKVRRPDLTFATVDHNVPTDGRPIDESTLAGQQLAALAKNCEEFNVPLFGYKQPRQGIVHIIGPQLGLTIPGVTLVCGDSHTSTHGALGALAFGIGTSEVEHVLATQTLRVTSKPKSLGIQVEGKLQPGTTPKDIILAIIRKLGAGGGNGYVAEYFGSTIRATGMAGRLTICNMSIEMGAKAGMIAPDDITFEYISAEDRPFAPRGADFDRMVEHARTLATDSPEGYDRLEKLDVANLKPQISWGTTPAMTVDIDQPVPDPQDAGEQRALRYMGLEPGTLMQTLPVNTVFIGSCTNARIEDLRDAAKIVNGRRVAKGVRAMVVPGSEAVRVLAEDEGLKQVFTDAGFEWHRAGCSMCLGMNGDILRPMERSASTSNRPYEGRQGPGSRTHLVSPITAAATAIAGHFTDPREMMY